MSQCGIHVKLIKGHWGDILRFMTTIKLKYTPTYSLLKRLSSHAREHPLPQEMRLSLLYALPANHPFF